jgi:hypothetical protein
MELLMSKWEELLEDMEYEPVHHTVKAGITLLEKYYRRADDTDAYFIAHGKSYCLSVVSTHLFHVSLGSSHQTGLSQCCLGSKVYRQGYGAVQG